MKIYVDTADIEEIKIALSWGIVDGVTTNPSLIKKAMQSREGTDIKEYIELVLKTAGKNCPVSLEVIGLNEADMYNQAIKLFELFNPIAENVVIKIPVNPSIQPSDADFDGLKVTKKLFEKNIPVNCTVVMTPEQALLAAKAGAKYISPFAGRIDDLLRSTVSKEFDKTGYYNENGTENNDKLVHDKGIVSGVDLINQCVKITKEYDTEIIAASIRNARQAREIAITKCQISTIPFNVIKEMIAHQKTYEAVANFTKDVIKEYEDLLQ